MNEDTWLAEVVTLSTSMKMSLSNLSGRKARWQRRGQARPGEGGRRHVSEERDRGKRPLGPYQWKVRRSREEAKTWR